MNNQPNNTIEIDKSHLAVIITLTIVCCVVGGYFIAYALKPPGYHEMYLLDAQNKADNYPQTVILNQNNTFHIPIVVTNNMRIWQEYQVQVKIVQHTMYFPVNTPPYNTYEFTLDADQSWNNQILVTLNEEGNYSIVIELYVKNNKEYVFTDNFCVLHIKAITNHT